ncbi:MAG: Rab family GTPase [Candidatus Helarchaeota archaeon]
MGNAAKHHVRKITIIGDYAVGKTSLLANYIEKKFSFDYKPSIGVNITTKEFKHPTKNEFCAVNFWDIAGQELFSNLRAQFYEGSDACAIVFDCTRKETFMNAKIWFRNLQVYDQDLGLEKIILIGNKADLQSERVVTMEEIQALSMELGIIYVETSALTCQNVNYAFESLIRQVLPWEA